MPFNYYVRSAIYETFAHATFQTCEVGTRSPICIQEETPGEGVAGIEVLAAFNRINSIAETESTTVRDIFILIAIGLVYKLLYAIGVIVKTRRVAMIRPGTASSCKKDNSSTKSGTSIADVTFNVAPGKQYIGLPAEVYEREIEV